LPKSLVSENLRAGYATSVDTSWYDPNHQGQTGIAGTADTADTQARGARQLLQFSVESL
jgi:hypothetical protein